MKIIAARVRVAVRVDSVMKLLQRKQFPGPPPPQQAAGLVLLIVQVAPLPPPHEMMDQFSHFTRTQDRHNTLIMLLLVNTPTTPTPASAAPPQVQATGGTGMETQCRDCPAEGHLQLQLCGHCDGVQEMRADCLGPDPRILGWLAGGCCKLRCEMFHP